MSAPLVALEDASLVYPGQSAPAIHSVNFSLGEGERIGLLGDNGSGKTSLLLALAGLRKLSSGRLLHRGEPVRKEKQRIALRREVGFVFQNPDDQLFSPTVLEDVAFGPLNLGFSPERAMAASLETLDRLGIGHLAESRTHTLSGGQKRIVSLATVWVMKPKALLLDEPTNDLDAGTRSRVVELLRENAESFVLVSHDESLVQSLTETVVRLTTGRIEPDRRRPTSPSVSPDESRPV